VASPLKASLIGAKIVYGGSWNTIPDVFRANAKIERSCSDLIISLILNVALGRGVLENVGARLGAGVSNGIVGLGVVELGPGVAFGAGEGLLVPSLGVGFEVISTSLLGRRVEPLGVGVKTSIIGVLVGIEFGDDVGLAKVGMSDKESLGGDVGPSVIDGALLGLDESTGFGLPLSLGGGESKPLGRDDGESLGLLLGGSEIWTSLPLSVGA
jgi:hypothetical protein